jgi:hypothetical protein
MAKWLLSDIISPDEVGGYKPPTIVVRETLGVQPCGATRQSQVRQSQE